MINTITYVPPHHICDQSYSDLICSICSFYTNNIVETACGHLLCLTCLAKQSDQECPQCPHDLYPIREPKSIIRIINNLEITCEGCNIKLVFKKYNAHKRVCLELNEPKSPQLHRPTKVLREHIINNNNVNNYNLKCPICSTTSNDIIETNCGHLFCHTCYLSRAHTEKCMLCDKCPLPISIAATQNRIANALFVQCPTCQDTHTLDQHFSHTLFCGKVI